MCKFFCNPSTIEIAQKGTPKSTAQGRGSVNRPERNQQCLAIDLSRWTNKSKPNYKNPNHGAESVFERVSSSLCGDQDGASGFLLICCVFKLRFRFLSIFVRKNRKTNETGCCFAHIRKKSLKKVGKAKPSCLFLKVRNRFFGVLLKKKAHTQ